MTDTNHPAQAIDLNHQFEAMRLLDQERQRLGWTVRDLEAKSGVSVSSFYAWQVNLRSPNLANLVALAQSLGFDIFMRRVR
jgi:transcriptional regulator with XRE-family HTH domain